jgi:L-arabinose isomerase
VAEHSQEMAQGMTQSGKLPVKVVFKPVVTTPDAIIEMCREANNAKKLHRPDYLDAHLLPGG